MRAPIILLALLVSTAGAAQVRLPVLIPRQPPPPVLMGIDALHADFLAKTGSGQVYFVGDSSALSPAAKATLAAQAQWLRQHPEVTVRIEGHADLSDTRDHALAVGARRAEEVRDFLVLLGVRRAQIATLTWGKERPGPPRAVTVLVR